MRWACGHVAELGWNIRVIRAGRSGLAASWPRATTGVTGPRGAASSGTTFVPVLNRDDVTSKALLVQVFGLQAVEWLCVRGVCEGHACATAQCSMKAAPGKACTATHTLPGTHLSKQQARLGTLHSSEPLMRVPRVYLAGGAQWPWPASSQFPHVLLIPFVPQRIPLSLDSSPSSRPLLLLSLRPHTCPSGAKERVARVKRKPCRSICIQMAAVFLESTSPLWARPSNSSPHARTQFCSPPLGSRL